MHLFADLLRGMRPLGQERGPVEDSDSDIDDDASGNPTPEASLHSQPSMASVKSIAAPSEATVEKRDFVASKQQPEQRQSSSPSAQLQDQVYPRTPPNPSRPRSKEDKDAPSPSASFSQTRRPYAASQASSDSLRSFASQSVSSVIHHTEARADGSPGMLQVPLPAERRDSVGSSRNGLMGPQRNGSR
jgi:hypothetical protein